MDIRSDPSATAERSVLTVKVVFMGELKRWAGRGEIAIELPSGSTIGALAALRRWFDNEVGEGAADVEADDRIDWLRVVPFVALHAACLAALLATRYPQYADQPFERVLVFRIVDLSGWSGES